MEPGTSFLDYLILGQDYKLWMFLNFLQQSSGPHSLYEQVVGDPTGNWWLCHINHGGGIVTLQACNN